MIGLDDLRTARTLLFVPGSAPDRFPKAAAIRADIVVIDLEDAVAADRKSVAREAAAEWIANGGRAIVRINAVDTRWHTADVDMAADLRVPVMLAKTGDPAHVNAVYARTGAPVLPLIETASGVASATSIASRPGVARLAFGSIDYANELGVDPTDRESLLLTRSMLVLASATAGVAPPVDGVTTALNDPAALTDDVAYAARIGLPAKLCIHPRQVAPVHAALAPTEDEIAWADRVVAAARIDGDAVAVDGHMVDAPVVARAERILATARR
ncbi:HpcH/HpaI aldolase/citrate lyase family protein [Gordonia humi]|uniref:Citrate lyase subunit beta/citryl-CoA lyase n=1 Tax=Gordonia humi TaxID=686429 RepID=A0A840F027_9ACTN|nr:CoA ester lyase [Gordonia humi]MBB4133730.1 citrate lyase subunit beta/citryl-CoA lyase [Gordonia humi]